VALICPIAAGGAPQSPGKLRPIDSLFGSPFTRETAYEERPCVLRRFRLRMVGDPCIGAPFF
jgi:hypothetical protein